MIYVKDSDVDVIQWLEGKRSKLSKDVAMDIKQSPFILAELRKHMENEKRGNNGKRQHNAVRGGSAGG